MELQDYIDAYLKMAQRVGRRWIRSALAHHAMAQSVTRMNQAIIDNNTAAYLRERYLQQALRSWKSEALL